MSLESRPTRYCPELTTLQSLLADELSAEQERQLDEHLVACAECQRRLEELGDDPPPVLFPQVLFEHAGDAPPTIPELGPLVLLAHGGMGYVYRARDLRLNRELAVKVMTSSAARVPDLVRRFQAEAQIIGQLTHPNIVPIHSSGTLADGRGYYTMKLVEGETLAALLRARPDVGDALLEFVQIFAQVCQAVAYAHSHGVLHRDLKPSNVMVGKHGEVQVMDWGIARAPAASVVPAAQEDETRAVVSTSRAPAVSTEHALGTWSYMPPEQACGLLDQVGEPADVFGLGGILCQILTGVPPYSSSDGDVSQQAREGRTEHAVARLRRSPADPQLIALAEQCLAREHTQRPADAAAVADAVADYLTGLQERLQQARVDRERQLVRAEEARRRRRVMSVLAVTGLALILLGTWSTLRHVQQQKDEAVRLEHERQLAKAGLDEAFRFADHYQWDAAASRIDDLNQRHPPGSSSDITRLISDAETDISRARELDRIRLEKTTFSWRDDERAGGRVESSSGDWRQGSLAIRRLDNSDAIADREFAAVFAQAGLGNRDDDPAIVAERIRSSLIRTHWVNALDDWAALVSNPHDRERLLEIARLVDPADANNALRDSTIWVDAEQIVDVAAGIDPSVLSPRLLAAVASRLSFEDRLLAPLLAQASARHPQDFTLHHALANASIVDDPAESAIHSRAAIALRPDAAVVYNNLGVAYHNLRRFDDAVTAHRKAIEIDDEYADAYTNLGAAYFDSGDVAQAIVEHQYAVGRDPSLYHAWKNLSIAYTSANELPQALRAIRTAVELRPGDADLHNQLGNVYAAQREHQQAIAAYKDAIRHHPEFAVAWYNLGIVLADDHQTLAAIAAYEKAIEFDPTFPHAYVNLGNLLRNDGRMHLERVRTAREVNDPETENAAREQARASYSKALGSFQQAVKISDRLHQAHIGVGNVFFDNKEQQLAAEAYGRALEIAPADAITYNNFGACLNGRNEYARALTQLQQAVALDPLFAGPYVNIAIAWDKLAQYDRSIEACKTALAIDPKLPNALGVMALVYRNKGDFANSLSTFETLLDVTDANDPRRETNLGRMAEVLAFLALAPRIDEYVADAVRAADAMELLMLAETCRHLGRNADAVRFFRETFVAEPAHAENDERKYRYHAARAALLAARHAATSGDGDAAREFRSQAREWLLAEVAAARRLVSGNPNWGPGTRWTLSGWKADPALSDVLEENLHAEVPIDEQAEWRDFWDSVEFLVWKLDAAHRTQSLAAGGAE